MKLAHRAQLALNTARMVFFLFALGFGILAIFIIGFRLLSGPLPVQQLSYSELLQQIDNENVRSATILTSKKSGIKIAGVIKVPEKSFTVPLETTQIENLRKHLVRAGVPTTSAEELETGSLGRYVVVGQTIVVFAIFLALVLWRYKKAILESKRLRSLEGK
jgi:ATP-dependent Zn protease